MGLTVKARIALLMGVVVAANVASAAVAAYYYAQAAENGRRAQAALETAQRVETVAQAASEFMTRVGDLSLSIGESSTSEDQSTTYGELQGADQVGSIAVERLSRSLERSDAERISSGWYALRLSAYAWVNVQAEEHGSQFRLRETKPGVFRSSVNSTLTTLPEFAGLSGGQIRATVRGEANGFRDGTLRRISASANAAAIAARVAENAAFAKARVVTLASIALSVLVSLATAVGLYRTIAAPLARARVFSDTVAAGNLSATLGKHSDDEIGAMTHAVENMKDSIAQKIATMQEMAGAVLYIAEQVKASAQRAHDDARSLGSERENLQAEIADVVQNSDMLSELASQMVAPQAGPKG